MARTCPVGQGTARHSHVPGTRRCRMSWKFHFRSASVRRQRWRWAWTSGRVPDWGGRGCPGRGDGFRVKRTRYGRSSLLGVRAETVRGVVTPRGLRHTRTPVESMMKQTHQLTFQRKTWKCVKSILPERFVRGGFWSSSHPFHPSLGSRCHLNP